MLKPLQNRSRSLVLVAIISSVPTMVYAEDTSSPEEVEVPETARDPSASKVNVAAPEVPQDTAQYESVVVGRPLNDGRDAGRASSEVTRRHIEERLPRSAPDALRYEPGAFVQQTAHGQGSTYVRGLTGQQTVLLFDGIRLNNATFRQGPNQYFFTVDSRTIASIEVTRGSSSVLYGSDALGGVIAATPREPLFLSTVERLRLTPRTSFRITTADDERGGRFELEAQYSDSVALLAGVGYRTVGLLEGGGEVRNPADGEITLVPRLDDDGRTQLGTGFDELVFDGRLVVDLGSAGKLIGATYGYREYNAPRTDQCPAAYAPYNECMTYEEQFRTLTYLAFAGDLGCAARSFEVILSFQNQHERRKLERPSSHVLIRGLDDVNTAGLIVKAKTMRFRPWVQLGLRWRYGTDFYIDWVSSTAKTVFTDVDVELDRSRGMYLNDSKYLWWGAYAEAETELPWQLTLRGGGRIGVNVAQAPGDENSGSNSVDHTWITPTGRGGIEWGMTRWLGAFFNIDQGVRAPNLDDLTSRQQTGPGFQFENAQLKPERSLTLETGLKLESRWVRGSAWIFWTRLNDAIIRAPRTADECPHNTPGCESSWNRFQLVNVPESSDIFGVEAIVFVRFPFGFLLRSTVAWTWGQGPNPGEPPSDPELEWQERVPLSRIPPLNGTVELRWRWRQIGLFASAALRWAQAQKRLALSDISDARIPMGGTPGFAVLDLRLGWRLDRLLQHRALLTLVFENVTDAAYRYHGSSVNGPGRGIVFNLELGV